MAASKWGDDAIMPKKYPNEFKEEVVRHYEQGKSIKSISQELHLAQSTIYRWAKELCSIETPVRKYTPTEFDKLFRHAKKLEHELEIIHCTGLVTEIPLQKKLALLEGIYHEGKYSVYELCEALNVARGTFYNHIFRRADRSGREREQAELMLKIQQIFDDSAQRYGAEKIRIVLADSGIRVGKKRIVAIMKELDLHSVRPEAKQQFKKQQQEQKKNWLERSFTAQRPNQTWVSDITYFRVEGYWIYLCIVLDLYSRRIVGFKVSKNASTNLVTATFRAAYEERGRPKDLTFHSDRGTQYTSKAMTALLQKCGVRQSFSATARPHDNAVAETFFATFKKEEAYRREYTSEDGFRKSVQRFIQFYNEVRPHRTLKYQTPQGFEDAYFAAKR